MPTIDEYLELAQKRTPSEITPEEVTELRETVKLTGDTLLGKQLSKLIDSYEMMRTEYEASNVREHLALDKLEASLEARNRVEMRLNEERARVTQLRGFLPVLPVEHGVPLEVPVDLKPIVPGQDAQPLEADQVIVLRLRNWQGAVESLRAAQASTTAAGIIPEVQRALDLLTKVDDGTGRTTEPSYDAPVGDTAETLKRGLRDLVNRWHEQAIHYQAAGWPFHQCSDELKEFVNAAVG